MKKTIPFMLCLALLSGCGGGSEEGSSQPWLGDKSPSTPLPPPTNTPPELSGLPQQLSVEFGKRFTVALVVSDAQGDALTVRLKNAPPWTLIEHDKNTKSYSLSGSPAEIGEFSGVVEISDGKATIDRPVTFVVTKPAQVDIEFVPPSGVDKSDTLSFVGANDKTVYITAMYDEKKDLFVAKVPLKDPAFSDSDLILSWQKPGGFVPYVRWIGKGSEILSKMDTRLMLPSSVWLKWLPDAKSSAYIHLITQSGASEGDAKIREWSSIAGHAISASNLRQVAMYYAMSREIPELFSLNKLIEEDLKVKFLHPQMPRTLPEKVNDARLRVGSLVSEQYWTDLKNKYQNEWFGQELEWPVNRWAIVLPSGLRQSASSGFVLEKIGAERCLLNGIESRCLLSDGTMQLQGPVRFDSQVSVLHLRNWLVSRGVSSEVALLAERTVLDAGVDDLEISEELSTISIRSLLWSADQRGVLDVRTDGEIQISADARLLDTITLNDATREMLALPKIEQPRHWIVKPKIFDLVVPFPQNGALPNNQASWLDLFWSPEVKALDLARSIANKNKVFHSFEWALSGDQTGSMLAFNRQSGTVEQRYKLTLIDESAPNFDHEEDIHGRQYSFIADIWDGDKLSSTSVQTGVLYPKARCEVSPLRENACLPASKVGLQGNDPVRGFWYDVSLGAAWKPDGTGAELIYQLKRIVPAAGQQADPTQLMLFEKELYRCEPGKIDVCPAVREWLIRAEPEKPGIWSLSEQKSQTQDEQLWLVLNRNVGDLVVYDVQKQQIRHFEYFEQAQSK